MRAGDIFYIVSLLVLLPEHSESFKPYGKWVKKVSKLFVQTATPEKEESIQINQVGTLKVPANAWRWPPVWPFPKEYLDPVQVSAATENNRTEPTISTFLSHFDNVSPIGKSNTLLVAPKSFQHMIDSVKFPFSFISIEDLESTRTVNYPDEHFDRVAVLAGIESLLEPRDVYRDIWRALKQGGACVSYFNGKPYIFPFDTSDSEGKGAESALRPMSMWTTMTDEQKIWIAGSYFQYAAPGGWTDILGFDLLGNSGEEKMKFELGSADLTAYAVQASKISYPPLQLLEGGGEPLPRANVTANLTSFLDVRLLGVRNLDKQDRRFVAIRLASDFSAAGSDLSSAALTSRLERISQVYAVLKDVKEAVIPSAVKALLATFLSSEWSDSELERSALAQAVGLQPPDADFWLPVSKLTAAVPPRQKIFLLCDLLPLCARKEPKLREYPGLLERVIAALKNRFAEVADSKVQSFASDLLVSDYLRGSSDAEKVLRFAQTYPAEALLPLLEDSLRQLDAQPEQA